MREPAAHGSFRNPSYLHLVAELTSGHCPGMHGHSQDLVDQLFPFSSYLGCSVSGKPGTFHPSYRLEETWETTSLSLTLILTSGNVVEGLFVLGVTSFARDILRLTFVK